MARKVRVHLLDDIDGSPADETVTFALDGITYHIDVTSARAQQLRASLEQFVGSARKLGRGHSVMATRLHRPAARPRGDRAQNQAVRDWAKRNGVELSNRGRIPRSILDQYETEAGR